MSESELLVIDGHSMAFRAFYALPVENFTTSGGQHTNAVYGFVSMLVKMLETHKPTHLAVAFDLASGSFRNQEYADYKAGRKKTPEEFKDQVPLIEQVLKAMGIAVLTKEGFEADDILATLARMGQDQGAHVLVASGDRDSFQLITDHVQVIYPGRSPSDLRIMDTAAIEEKYGVEPARYPHIAALVGEKADNLPGVPGVGEKTAAQWIRKYDGLEGVLANADKIGGKRGEALREHAEDVKRNRRLNHLRTDVDLGVDLDALRRQQVDHVALGKLFESLQFRTLRDRVRAVDVGEASGEKAQQNSAPQETRQETQVQTTRDISVQEWAKQVEAARGIAIDVFPHERNKEIAQIALYRDSRALVLDPLELDAKREKELGALLASAPLTVRGAKTLRHQFAQRGMELGDDVFDVELAAYLCQPGQANYRISSLAQTYLDREVPEPEDRKQQPLFTDTATIAQLACAVFDLRDQLEQWLDQRNARELLAGLEAPLQQVLYQMETRGIQVDRRVLQDLAGELAKETQQAAQGAYDAIGKQVNLSSPKQLQTVLFEDLNMPKTRKIKTGYTTNAAVLEKLYAQTHHPFLENLLAHRDKIKRRQTVDGLIDAVAPDGRIHTTFQQTAAATGRLASSDPNLQNIPARTSEGMRIREAFVPGQDYDLLVTADYSQIEMRIMAHLSRDSALIEAFKSGEDLHKTMAAMVFHVPVEDVDQHLRSRIKATSYGLAYGLSAYGLSQQLGTSVNEARALREQYFERFGGVQDFLQAIVQQARHTGYTETIMGRRRYFPDLNSTNRQRREIAERAALNAPIQGSAADIIKVAMLNVEKALAEAGLRARMLLQVHDELVLEVGETEVDQVESILREQMGSAGHLDVPLDVSVGVGTSWRTAAH